MDILREFYKNMIKKILGNNTFDDMDIWLRIDESNKYYDGIFPFIHSIYDTLATIGMLACVIFFFINMIDKSTKQELTIVEYVKECMMLVFCIGIISSGFDLLTSFSTWGTGLLDSVREGATSESSFDFLDKINKEIDDMSALEILASVMSLGFFSLISHIADIWMVTISISRAIFFIVYGAMFPIGVADLYRNGQASNGIKYIKRLISITMQGAVLVMICMASLRFKASFMIARDTTALSLDTLMDSGSVFMANIAILLATVALMHKSMQICDNIVGV